MSTLSITVILTEVLLFISLLSNMLIVKKIKSLQLSFYFRSYVYDNQYCSKYTTLLLFSLDTTNPQVDIEKIQKKFCEDNIKVIFIGPQWKANVIKRKIRDNYEIRCDETNNIGKKMDISKYPHYIRLNQDFVICESGHLN